MPERRTEGAALCPYAGVRPHVWPMSRAGRLSATGDPSTHCTPAPLQDQEWRGLPRPWEGRTFTASSCLVRCYFSGVIPFVLTPALRVLHHYHHHFTAEWTKDPRSEAAC